MTAEAKRWRTGGRRSCDPSETWARLRPLLPVFGITRVADITGLDRIGVPVFTACRPNSRSLSVFQGKGLTRDQAQVSAVMEAYETWCAETIDHPLKYASIDELCFSHPLINLARLPLAVPSGVDPQRPFLWIEGADLMSGGELWLPFEMVHANYAHPEPQGSGAFPMTTNGLASGNTREEAILHALMEVIERDAATLWKLGPHAWRSPTAIRPKSVRDPGCRDVLDRFDTVGIEVAIWDIRSDIGLPSFMCLIHDPTGRTGAAELGAGAHPAPDVALMRALSEAAQARATFIAGAREDIADAEYAPQAVAARQDLARDITSALRPERDFDEIETRETDTFAGDIAAVLDALRRAGITQAAVADIGKPRLPFAVVRAVVPGLEGALEGPGSPYVPGERATTLLAEAAE